MIAWLLLACGGRGEVADCAQPRLWYGPPGAEPATHWGCRPPTQAWEVLPAGFLDPLDTGWVIVGNEVDWDVPWPSASDDDEPEAEKPSTGLTGETGWPTGDTGVLQPIRRRKPPRRDPDDTAAPPDGEPPTGLTGFTGFTGFTGVTGITGDTAEPGAAEPAGEPTGQTGDTGAPSEPEPPAPVVDPTDLVVPGGGPVFQDPRDLVVPEER